MGTQNDVRREIPCRERICYVNVLGQTYSVRVRGESYETYVSSRTLAAVSEAVKEAISATTD